MKVEHTSTYYFLLPMLGIEHRKHSLCGIKEVYLGCPEFQGDDDWGKYMYVTYTNWKDADPQIKKEIKDKSLDLFTNEVDGLITLVFDIPEKYAIDIQYFIRGEYSKIDREYVRANFPIVIKDANGEEIMNPNRGILDKAGFIRDAWEFEHNVKIPEGAEVWSKPDKSRELLTKKTSTNDPEFLPVVPLSDQPNTV